METFYVENSESEDRVLSKSQCMEYVESLTKAARINYKTHRDVIDRCFLYLIQEKGEWAKLYFQDPRFLNYPERVRELSEDFFELETVRPEIKSVEAALGLLKKRSHLFYHPFIYIEDDVVCELFIQQFHTIEEMTLRRAHHILSEIESSPNRNTYTIPKIEKQIIIRVGSSETETLPAI